MLLPVQSLHLSCCAVLPFVKLTNSLLPSGNVSLESGLGYAGLAEPEGVNPKGGSGQGQEEKLLDKLPGLSNCGPSPLSSPVLGSLAEAQTSPSLSCFSFYRMTVITATSSNMLAASSGI